MNTLASRALLLSTTVLGLSFLSIPVRAQPATPAATALQEVVVTARRREENAQTVSVSVTALSAQALEERQVHTLGDLTYVAPGLRFVNQGGGGNMNVTLRGLNRIPVGDAPNAVITYFADIPLNYQGSNIPTYDLASIQVLKGPQGTLFGRNSIAGAVVITPQLPTHDFEGYAKVSAGNIQFRDFEGAVNIPLMDKAAVRLAGKISRRDGYTENLGLGGDLDNTHQDSFRGSLLLEPSNNIRNLTVADYFKADEEGSSAVLGKVLPTGLARTAALARFFDCHTVNASNPVACVGDRPDADIDDAFALQQRRGVRTTATSIDPQLYRRTWGVSNKTEVDLGAATFRNIVGYRKVKVETDLDTDGVTFIPPIIDAQSRANLKQLSEEAQLFGQAFDGRLDWIVGAFYFKEQPNGPQGGRFSVASTTVNWISSYVDRRTKAAFGQVGFQIVPSVKLNAGYRYSRDSADACTIVLPGVANNPPAGPLTSPDTCPSTTGSSRITYAKSAPTWTLGIDWQVDPNLFAYVVTRRGYREGGVNAPAYNTPCTTGNAAACTTNRVNPPDLRPYQTYEPERITDLEVGLKSDWRVGEVSGRFNISAYTAKYEDVVIGFNTSPVVPGTDLAAPQQNNIGINTGDQTLRGAEAELIVNPATGLTLRATGAYTHQKFDSLKLPAITGLVLPAFGKTSPEWALAAGVRYVLPVRPMDGEVIVNADYYWQGTYGVVNATMPSYDVTNMRVEWNGIAGKPVSAAFFVRNVFDQENAIVSAATNNALSVYTFSYAEPRFYGIELTFRWGQ